MKRPKKEAVPNQGCGIFFLLVLSVLLLLSIPVLRYTYAALFEKHILFSSDSPDETYHIVVSRNGSSNEILIEEVTTSSELRAFIQTELWVDVDPEAIAVEWLGDTAAQIVVTGRDEAENYFRFDAEAEEEKIEKVPDSTEQNR